MAQIEGLSQVLAKLKELERKTKEEKDPVATVGYTQAYALTVHEDLEARHSQGKTAKYLEIPARLLSQQVLPDIIQRTYRRTGSLSQGLLLAGLRLQRESQEIVPVDTSALKASAFTALEYEKDQAAGDAFNKSEGIRRSEDTAVSKLALRKKISPNRARRLRSERRANRRNKPKS